MIVSFHDQATDDLYHGRATHRLQRFPGNIRSVALQKSDMLHAAHKLVDLQVPPGNRLEALKGDLRGFHSIRVSDQWRLVYRWEDGNAYDVEILDYHS